MKKKIITAVLATTLAVGTGIYLTKDPYTNNNKLKEVTKEEDIIRNGLENYKPHRVHTNRTVKRCANVETLSDYNDEALFNSKGFIRVCKVTPEGVKQRDRRFNCTDKPLDNFVYLKTSKRHTKEELKSLVINVTTRLPHIPTNERVISLLVETAIAESDGGRILISGTDLGMYQIKEKVSKECLKFLKAKHEDAYVSVLKLRDKELSERDNLLFNLPYATAIAITEYWRKGGGNIWSNIGSTLERAKLWKLVYNTHLGDGTVNKFIQRNKEYKL